MNYYYSTHKILAPSLDTRILRRTELVTAVYTAIDTSTYKLILLNAPAGYGKTTLLALLAEYSHLPFCWYFLESSDDEATFLYFFVMSVRQRFPYFCNQLPSTSPLLSILMGTNTKDRETVTAALEELIMTFVEEITEPCFITLCNYQEVNAKQTINAIVDTLIQRLPATCLLIIESRAIPSLQFAQLLAYQKMLGLGSNELKFTPQELLQLAHILGEKNFSQQDAEQIIRASEGWITGIYLNTRLGDLHPYSQHEMPQSSWRSFALPISQQQFSLYLRNDVFKREQQAYAFLQQASILQRMNATFCRVLLNEMKAEDYLQHLEQQGLFVVKQSERQGDREKDSYLCHPLLRDFLHNELRVEHPEQYTRLHLQAARLFDTQQDAEQAIYHALAAQAYDIVVHNLLNIHKDMFARGNYNQLSCWIDALPAETIAFHPQLQLTRARISLSTGNYSQARNYIDMLSPLLSEKANATIWAEALVVRSSLFFHQSNYSAAERLCRQALAILPAEESILRAEAHHRLGTGVALSGNVHAGIAEMHEALCLLDRNQRTRQGAVIHGSLANAYGLIGLNNLSEHHGISALQCYQQIGDSHGEIDTLISLGVTKQRRGAFAEAEQTLCEALRLLSQDPHYQRGLAYALVSLADVYQDQNRYREALTSFEEGLSLAHKLEDNHLTQYATYALASTYLLSGDAQTALQLTTQLTTNFAHQEQTISYETVLRDLVVGTAYLYQDHHSIAKAYLSKVQSHLQTLGLKREHIQTLIRLAACALEEKDRSIQYIQDAITIARQNGYEYLIPIELQRLPTLLHEMQICSCGHQLDLSVHTPNLITIEKQPLPEIAIEPVRLRTIALGEPLVYRDDTPIKRWRTTHAMELYFFLMHANQAVHKEQIVTQLWPSPDEHTDQAFRSACYYLRKLFGPSSLIGHAGSYQLDLSASFGNATWYDVAAFQEQYRLATEKMLKKEEREAKSLFEQMIQLYRGDYLQPFYNNWCFHPRDELRRTFMDAHQQLAMIAWREQKIDHCISHYQLLLSLDECLEEAHYGLMRCYIKLGKRGAALRQYQRCKTILHDELAVSPGPLVEGLYQRLKSSSIAYNAEDRITKR